MEQEIQADALHDAHSHAAQRRAAACQWTGVSQAIPVHYAHNAQVLGVEAGDEFKRALAKIAPRVRADVLKPGETRVIQFED
jgi:L-ascorbate metabolism protein UlaG (beta-lactamase superfamily)